MAVLLFSFFVHLLSLHPYFVSVFEVEHNPETNTIQVAARIFISDLEEALQKEGHANPKIGTPDELPEANEWITSYINTHFTLTADGTPVELNYLGKEADNDVIWCYLESPIIETIETLDIFADLLIDLQPTQTNMVHVKIWGTKASAILRKGRTKKQLLYSELH